MSISLTGDDSVERFLHPDRVLNKRTKRSRHRPRRARLEPAPVTISFKCPRCGGAHPVDRCDKPLSA